MGELCYSIKSAVDGISILVFLKIRTTHTCICKGHHMVWIELNYVLYIFSMALPQGGCRISDRSNRSAIQICKFKIMSYYDGHDYYHRRKLMLFVL